MEKDMATLLDAVTFQVSDMMAPATVLEAAGRHLLDRLDLTDPHRWAVTSALGSITAARKALEAASEELLHVVAQDGADMHAVGVSKGEIVEPNPQCQSRCQFADDDGTWDSSLAPVRCVLDLGHAGEHGDLEGRQWRNCAMFKPMIYDDPDLCFDCGLAQSAHCGAAEFPTENRLPRQI